MHFTQTLIAALAAASSAVAAPAEPAAKSMMAPAPQWTIEKLQRVCDKGDQQCTWTFGINTHVDKAPATACKLEVKGPGASRAKGGPARCGDYTVTSGWSGQFGEGKGFTTLSVVDNKKRLIVWPAYNDNQVKDGKPVQPDQSYAPQTI
ncbi:hypothetical protein HIM_07876 [Hirsutella minnesotensis 3608]|uniref:Small secreted protein n=1 Tax=Hirsutella minnesotensis 3608 TaxID=1043627 RepID=A0A0F8A3Z4_9HYPO|nr:hypothetical protein HIM_07876 [Hirsutella minnesotensis 3608]